MTALHWVGLLDSAQQAAVVKVVDAAALEDGVAPVGEQVLREVRRSGPNGSGSDPGARHLLASDSDGEIVGYLNLTPELMGECVVHPGARRRGIGAQLIIAGADEAALGSDRGQIRFWAHGTLSAARALASSLGMQPVRELLQMRRSLLNLPDVVGRDDIRIRTYAGAQDDAELLRVNNAAFSWHPEQGGWEQSDIDSRRDDAWFDPAGLFLAVDAQTDELLGFHWTKIHSSESGLGEVYVVGVDPAAQGRGLGKFLTLIGIRYLAQRLNDHDDPTVMLYVEADNSAAVRTYRNLGFDVANMDTAFGF